MNHRVVEKRAFAEAELPALRALLDERVVAPTSDGAPAKKPGSLEVLAIWIALVIAFVAIYQLMVVPQ